MLKDVCRRLAKLGYVALAPAFFVRVADPAPLADMQAVMKIVSQASDPQVMGDVGAAIQFLQAAPYVEAARMAITGFCWGGGTTWLPTSSGTSTRTLCWQNHSRRVMCSGRSPAPKTDRRYPSGASHVAMREPKLCWQNLATAPEPS